MVLQKGVTPVKTGVQSFSNYPKHWLPAFAGLTRYRNFRLFARTSYVTRDGKNAATFMAQLPPFRPMHRSFLSL
jgi:hypothetical protein